MNFKFIGKTFGRGLIVVLPAVLTLYLLWWLGAAIEGVFQNVLKPLPFVPYVPGMGLVLAIALVFIIGLLMKASLFRKLFQWFESQLEKVPLIKSFYGSFRDLMDFFSGEKAQEMNKVVMVDLDGSGRQRLIGFVTRETFSDLPEGIGDDDHVAVYMPMSYQLGGFTTVVPRSAVTTVNMNLDEAMKFAITAGVKKTEANGVGKQESEAPPERPA